MNKDYLYHKSKKWERRGKKSDYSKAARMYGKSRFVELFLKCLIKCLIRREIHKIPCIHSLEFTIIEPIGGGIQGQIIDFLGCNVG